MRELERKRQRRRMLYSFPSLLIMAALCLILAKGAYGLVGTQKEGALERDLLSLKVDSLRKKESELKESLAKLQSPQGLEEEFKAKFNVARVGEKVAVIVTPKEEASTTTTEDKTWFQKLWDAIIFWK